MSGAANACGPGTELEAPGLIPGTRLRPADVLTGALGNGLVALDVGIASPDAVAAGQDCVQNMYRRKTEYYEAHSDTLGCEIWRRAASQVMACWPDREQEADE